MPTLLEKAIAMMAMILFVVYFRQELAAELRLLKQDLSQWFDKKATKKSP